MLSVRWLVTDRGATRVDLDDSRVLQVRRVGDVTCIKLKQRRGGAIKRIVVVASGVTAEDAEYYIGHNVTAPHPNPTVPLDFVETAEIESGHLELGGYLKGESWFTWRIAAREIELK